MRICAYCNKNVNLTREHIFPNFIIKNNENFRTFRDSSIRSSPHNSAPIIKDVCNDCNNNKLASLDRYGSNLEKNYFSTSIENPIDLKFKYDFPLILRWFLKIFYNAARSQQADLKNFKKLTSYILGETGNCSYPVSLFIGLIGPSKTRKEHQKIVNRTILYPDFFFIDKIDPNSYSEEVLEKWHLTLRSYIFIVIIWNLNINVESQKNILKKIPYLNNFIELFPNKKEVHIQNSCSNTYSIYDERIQYFPR